MREPRVLAIDVESIGVNALKADLGRVAVFGYKFLDEPKAHCIMARQKDLRNFDDRWLLKRASKIIEQADILVGHFASVFDRRFIQGRLLVNGLPPIPATRMRDTCMIARSVATFSSNRLVHLAKILKLKHQKHEKKGDSAWPDAWFRMMQGDMKALKAVAEYCMGDVLATEELYLKLRPFDNAHPRIVTDRSKCSTCGGDVEYRGFSYVGTLKYRRYVCSRCRRWDRERNAA